MKEFKPSSLVSNCKPYQISESGKLKITDKKLYSKLDWNEACYPPSNIVKKRLIEAVEDGFLNYYPDTSASELRSKLSHYVGVDDTFIQVFNGSDAALQTICFAFLNNNDNALVRDPTYTQIYPFLNNTGARVICFVGQTPFTKSIDKYHDYLSKNKIKMVYIANPNNPTGILYEKALVKELLERYPETFFIIDEAYFEYAKLTVVDLVRDFNNLAVTRTFSKAFGLAGLRLGYVISQPKTIENLNKIYNRKDVNILAQIAASAALDDIPYMESQVNELIKTKTWLINELKKLNIEIHDTHGNFILIKVQNTNLIIEELKKEKILVRDRSSLPQMDGYIRITVGLLSQMGQFVKAISRIVYLAENRE